MLWSSSTYDNWAKFGRSDGLEMIAHVLPLQINTLDLACNDIKTSVCSENKKKLFKELKESMKIMNQPNENLI